WDSAFFWRLKPGVSRERKDLPVDWSNLQRPGFSADYIGDQYERRDMAYEKTDWEATADGKALLRNNQPLLGYIAGKPARFTSKDHIFFPRETVEKQLVIINNSREPVTCRWVWGVNAPRGIGRSGQDKILPGEQVRIPISFPISITGPEAAGTYTINASFNFSTGESQIDSFTLHVLPPVTRIRATDGMAIFDPKGETTKLLSHLGLQANPVDATADLSPYKLLLIGKGALTVDGPAPDLSRVRDGLKVIMFEQIAEALEKRLGFRATEYGLRQIFPRVSGHPILQDVGEEHLRDWRGEATLTPPRLTYTTNDDVFNGAPTVKWCDLPVTRVWRCGNRGNVASVLIEKPARGNFLPLVDGGYALQYSPLIEYREGKGMILFCQLDVSGRTEDEPAADALVSRMMQYVSTWQPTPSRRVRYAGEAAGSDFLKTAGVTATPYNGGGLSAEEVLIVGPGAQLTGSAGHIATWLKNGGRIIALGLDESTANAFLPTRIGMDKTEYICAQFPAPGPESPFVGIACADTHNRDPRNLPLVTGGATVIGNGVLAAGDGVVFCQLVPWQFDYQAPRAESAPEPMNLKRTFRRSSVLVSRLLANAGVQADTPVLERISKPAAVDEKRWLQGLYLDQPEEWDDPYRFFRW
ncbi:MAG: hypothetical protein LUO89_06190, partial [Methanothrix sp.]|nr:hypothetical protein [Methanothrix sp.]